MLFNLCLINLGQVSVAESLAPLINYMRQSLSKCGHEVTVSHEHLTQDGINLFFEGFHIPEFVEQLIQFKKDQGLRFGLIATELIQAEEIPYAKHGVIYPEHINKTDALKRRLKGYSDVASEADFVWSFLERTAAYSKKYNAASYHYPVGYVQHLCAELRRSPKDIDVLFFGGRTPHRERILKALAERGINVMAIGRGFPSGVLPAPLLLSLLDRAKIGLNLTLESEPTTSGIDPRFVSCMRVTEMMDRDLLVVSEDIPEDNPYKAHMVNVPPDHLAICSKDILQTERWKKLGKLNATSYREKMQVTNICLPVIEQTLKALR